MERPAANRLSALDSFFLLAERGAAHMHVGATLIFETGPLRAGDGSLDVRRLRTHIGSRLHLVPRFRQRLAHSPLRGWPLWVDAEKFDLRNHVKHVALSGPLDEEHLRVAAAEILSRPLRRDRPLWEMWIVEGSDPDRFGVVSKIHHCMADGIGNVEQMCAILSFSQEVESEPAAPRWTPRPSPNLAELAIEEIRGGAASLLGLGGQALGVLQDPGRFAEQATGVLSAAVDALDVARRPAVGFRGSLSPARSLGWISFDIAEVKRLKRAFGATVNDIALAVVTGGLRRYLSGRVSVPGGASVRAAVPVSVRDGRVGDPWGANHVSIWFVPLPIGEQDPRARLGGIRDATRELKRSGSAKSLDGLIGLADWMGPTTLGAVVRLLEVTDPYDLIVTNVPGPQQPLYLLGARLIAAYPIVPLFENHALGIALLSYDGRLFCGLYADPAIIPDLSALTRHVGGSFDELQSLAGLSDGAPSERQPTESPASSAASAGQPAPA